MMPIPILVLEADESERRKELPLVAAREAKVLQFPVPIGRVVENPQKLLRDRFSAHAVDAVVVHGFSLYLAKVVSFLLALRLMGDVSATESAKAAVLFHSVVAFGTLRIWALSFVVFSCIYVTLGTHYWGRTIGKALFHLKVVRGDGGLPDMRQSFMRYVGYCFTYASLGITFIVGFLGAENHTVHDRLSATDVVRSSNWPT